MSNDTDSVTSYGEYKVGVFIWKTVPPILIILGTLGNTLTIIVLTRRSIRSSTTALYLTVLAVSDLVVLYSGLLRQWLKSIRSSTTALYLTVLAVSDLVVLYSGLLRQWLKFLFETDVRHVSNAGCKINIWFVYTSLDFSAWILIAVTLERVISAWFPHSAKSTCTKKSAIAFISSILAFLLLLNCHMLYGMGFKYDDNGAAIEHLKCREVDASYVHFFNKVWPWIDLCAFCLVPCSVIIVGNSLILFKVIKSQKKTKSRIVPSINTASQRHQAPHHGHGKQSSMTAMLFTLNVVFLVSTSPVSIYNIGYAHWAEDAERNHDNHALAVLDLWWAIVNMLMYTNNSLNFLLYCLSGTKFRQEVIRMFCRRQLNNNIPRVPSNYTRTRFEHSSGIPLNTKVPLHGSTAEGQTTSSPKDNTSSPKMITSSPQTSERVNSNNSGTSDNGVKNANGDLKIATIGGNMLHPDMALQKSVSEESLSKVTMTSVV